MKTAVIDVYRPSGTSHSAYRVMYGRRVLADWTGPGEGPAVTQARALTEARRMGFTHWRVYAGPMTVRPIKAAEGKA